MQVEKQIFSTITSNADISPPPALGLDASKIPAKTLKLLSAIAGKMKERSGCEDEPAWYAALLVVFRPKKMSYSVWRHGGWYVTCVDYPQGSCGCVSNNYPDKKWRIVCDDRRTEISAPGDFTFPTREAAAIAEHEIAKQKWEALFCLD